MHLDKPDGENYARLVTDLALLKDGLWHEELLSCLSRAGIPLEMQPKAALIIGEEMGKARVKAEPMLKHGWVEKLARKDITVFVDQSWEYTRDRLDGAKIPDPAISAIAALFKTEVERTFGLPAKSPSGLGR